MISLPLTVEVEIFESELFQGLVQSLLDFGGLMRVVPEFRSDEQLFALDDRGDNLLQGASDLVLILVHSGKVKMPVPMANGDLNLMVCVGPWLIERIGGDRTAFSTSWGLESQVPRPIWGNGLPLDRVMIFPKDIVDRESRVKDRGKEASSSDIRVQSIQLLYLVFIRRTVLP